MAKEIDSKLVSIMACPKCGGEVKLSDGKDSIVCSSCKLKYKISNGIPVMLTDEAESL